MEEKRRNNVKQKEDRVGEINYNKQGEMMEIVEYYNFTNVMVLLKDTNTIVKARYDCFKKGNIRDINYPSVWGIGIIGEEKYIHGTKSYNTWKSFLERCYDDKYKSKHPTYNECTVCNEWLYYPNFKKWFDENYYEIDGERMELDKDILVQQNKIYSPKTCVFVPQRINTLFVKKNKNRGNCPIGVHYNKGIKKYIAQLEKDGKCIKIGNFDSKNTAFQAYKMAKEKYIKEVADEYKDKIPKRLYDAMYKYEVEITD